MINRIVYYLGYSSGSNCNIGYSFGSDYSFSSDIVCD